MRMIYTEGYQFPSGATVVQRMGKRTRLRCKCGTEHVVWNTAMSDKQCKIQCAQCSYKERRRHDYEGIAADYRAGMTVPEIGRKYGLKNPDKLVYEVLKSLGVKRNRRTSAAQVQVIRKRYAKGGVRYHQLASEYGLSETQVARIVTGKAWAEPVRCR